MKSLFITNILHSALTKSPAHTPSLLGRLSGIIIYFTGGKMSTPELIKKQKADLKNVGKTLARLKKSVEGIKKAMEVKYV